MITNVRKSLAFNHPIPKRVSWKENVEILGVNENNKVEFKDPAILDVKVKKRYDANELLKIRESPLSKARPVYLDTAYDSNGIWDPQLWHYNKKSADTATERQETRQSDTDNHRRRSGDPRERIRKEQDGIVLSPQRRSFISGCYVPGRDNRSTGNNTGNNNGGNRSHSPLSTAKNDAIGGGHREIPTTGRRIGSGRILSWGDYQEKGEMDNEFGYRRDRRDSDRDERYERRSFGRDFDMNRSDKEKERHIGRNGRFGSGNDRRRLGNDIREEEPEWFTGGPLSQTDTIELRGFEDGEKGGKRRPTAAQKKKAKERNIVVKVNATVTIQEQPVVQPPSNEQKQATKEEDGKGSETGHRVRQASPIPAQEAVDASKRRNSSPKIVESKKNDEMVVDKRGAKELKEQSSLDLEDIFKCDSLTGFYTNGVGGGETTGGSRFSQWFTSDNKTPEEKPNGPQGSRRSSVQEEPHHLIKNLLDDIVEPNVSIPGDTESYFAPISPAANTISMSRGQPTQQAATKPVNLMEMLQRGKQPRPVHGDMPPVFKNAVVGKVMSLEELEARMMHGGSNNNNNISMKHLHNSQQKSEEEAAAFKKLFAQVANQQNPMNNGPISQTNMSTLEMLQHSQKQEDNVRRNHMMNSKPPQQQHLNNDLNYKYQQIQNQQRQQQIEMLSKIMGQTNVKTLPDISLAQSRELLSRPEAQAILQALHQRIPSPRELQVHTQNIMQRALIKKKLEEQQENFRKKQEMQHGGGTGSSGSTGGGVSPAKNVSSPTPLTFTPTAVLRKMTADKDDGGKDSSKSLEQKLPPGRPLTGMRTQTQQSQQPSQQSQQQFQHHHLQQQQPPPPPQQQQPPSHWNNNQFQPLKQHGRPIVKVSNNFPQQNNQEQQYYQQQQQQRLFNQQQQQQQQRKSGQFAQGLSQTSQFSQFTSNQQFQQLRAQHQQHHVRSQHQQQQPAPPPQAHQQQQPSFNNQPTNWQQMLQNQQSFDNKSQSGRNENRGIDLSPTSNQFARWFSPDLLERARNGKLPTLPSSTHNQHALNLEEIERQTASVAHN